MWNAKSNNVILASDILTAKCKRYTLLVCALHGRHLLYWELLALFDISAWYLHSHHSIWPGCSQEEKSLKMQCNHIPSSLIEISNNYSGHRFSAYLHNDWNKMLKLYNQMWDMQRKPKHSIDTTHLFFPYHMEGPDQPNLQFTQRCLFILYM